MEEVREGEEEKEKAPLSLLKNLGMNQESLIETIEILRCDWCFSLTKYKNHSNCKEIMPYPPKK